MKMSDVYHNQIIGFRNSKGDKVIAIDTLRNVGDLVVVRF